MSSFHIRPRFSQRVKMSPEEVQSHLRGSIEPIAEQFEIKEFPDFFCLRIAERDRHFWSPRLNLSLERDESGATWIHGIYGPNANAWSLFLFSYLIVGFLGLLAGGMAVAQWTIGSAVTWGWAVAAAVVGLVVLYIVAQFGQKLGAQQMFQIHQAYETAIGDHVEVH